MSDKQTSWLASPRFVEWPASSWLLPSPRPRIESSDGSINSDGSIKMLSQQLQHDPKSSSPSPQSSGERGSGGEGPNRLETMPPHPQPFSPEYRGEGSDNSHVLSIGRYPNRIDSNHAFTLVELLVVLVIIGILSALVMGALRGAQQDTLAAKTRGTIAKIDAVLNEKFDEYLTRPLKFMEPNAFAPNLRESFPNENRVPAASPNAVRRITPPIPPVPKGLLRERVRLAATRDLMRMEMPDCVGDLFASIYPRPGMATPLPSFSPYPSVAPSPARPLLYSTLLATGYFGPTYPLPGPSPVPLIMRLETPHAFQRIVQRVWQADQRLSLPLPNGRQKIDPNTGTPFSPPQPARWSDTFANEELLFLIVEDSYVDGSPAMESFAASEIGDKDDDGLKEFLDAWGNPIRWIRWPAGANTVTPLNPDPLNPGGSPSSDPFDPTFADVGFDIVNYDNSTSSYPFAPGNGLRPLVVSAGQDGRFGIRFHSVVPPNQPTGPTSPTPGITAPFFSPSSVMLGTTSFLRPAYWSFGPFNWPDPYCPREFPNTAKRGALLNATVDLAGDPIGVDLNLGTFIPNPNTNSNFVAHAQDNVSNLDESGAAP